MINKMCFGGIYVTVDQDIANQINMHFCEIGEKLQNVNPNLGYDYKRYLPIRIESTFFLSPTNIDEILNEIKKLNPKIRAVWIILERKWSNFVLRYSLKI